MNRFKTASVAVLNRLLPAYLKNSLFHLSFHLSRAEFDRFAYQVSFAPHMEFGLGAMARLGVAPRTIIDVGAFEGDWSRLAKRIWPTSKLIMIEPNSAKQPQLARVATACDAELLGELLGAQDDEEVQFYLMESGSSIMSERSPLQRKVEKRRLCRLDSLIGNLDPPSLLKIDAQGYELQILKGSTAILPACEGILLEIATIEINEGAPLLHEVVSFMKEVGFVAYDILEIHRRPLDRALNQMDIMFIPERSRLIADKRHFTRTDW